MNWKERLWNHKAMVLVVILLLGGIIGVGRMILRPREVTAAPIAQQEVLAEVEGTGTVSTKVLAKVGSKISGRIERMLVEEGDIVKAGQVVAVLEDTDLRRQVDLAGAQLEAARASAWQAERAWERAKRLLPSGAIGQEEAEVAEERQRVAERTVQAQEAQLRYQEFKLSETKVPTFVSGLVTKRWVEAGDAVVAGQPVVTVADTGVIWVDANVDQRFAGEVRKNQPATVILRGRSGRPFKGYVYRVYPQADPVTEEMLVQVAFALPPKELQVGQWAEVYIEVGKVTHALVVPKAAVVPVGNDRFIFVVGHDGRVRRVKVEPGATSPRSPIVAVKGDLMAGEQVVLMPMGLQGGERVRVKQVPDSTPPRSGT
ncbi:MAG: efflux RND transporter periplasmic adaptor subunit [candidate division NC10 bacterium]|nr:efflux RND transporter periplasmic adaptor subunit [candidate division NC10 bacterium]